MNYVNVGYNSTNYYLVDCQNGRLLIDIGFPETKPQFLASLRRFKIDLSEITHVFVTHFHPDHAGLLSELLATTDMQPFIMKGQLAYVREMEGYFARYKSYQPLHIDSLRGYALDESRAFLRSIGLDGHVLHTPGHSNDSHTLLLDDGTAFTGDLQPVRFVADGLKQTRESWILLKNEGLKQVCPGHGSPSRR